MRIIAGSARSLPLKSLPGTETRPTTDRIKETLFNMIQFDIPGCRFLDLFAGTGSIGLEAISRGAKACVFVDNSRRAARCIQENIDFTKFQAACTLMCMDAVLAISRLEGRGRFDLVFMDAPYGHGLELEVLEQLRNSTVIDENTKIIIETSLEIQVDVYACDGAYEITKDKKYKTNRHVFLRRIS